MYEPFYCLKENPFSLTPDPEFLFLNQNYQAAMDQVLYAIRRREGFTVIVGDVGTGKTTLCWALLGRLENGLQTALVLDPLLTAEDMLRAIIQDFGIKRRRHACAGPGPDLEPAPDEPNWMEGMTRKELIDELNFFLVDRAEEDVFCVLIIDEAQNLSPDVLEQLRLLSNLETAKKKLLQIIFVGQIEFTQKLKTAELRSLNQRISIRYELKPLSPDDTVRYIAHRLKIAQASPSLDFTRGALNEVYKFSQGYPRLVNLICDRALLAGYSEGSWTITGKMVREAARKLRGQDDTRQPQPLKLPRRLKPALALALITLASLVILWTARRILTSSGIRPDPSATVAASVSPVPDSASALPQPAPAVMTVPPPVVPSKASKPVAAAKTGGTAIYRVRVHSLREKWRADAAVRELQQLGFSAHSSVEDKGRRNRLYAVTVGPFDLQGAQKCMSDLRARRFRRLVLVRASD